MGQRVNISYSVELDELDIEVQRLIKTALIEIQHVVGQCNAVDQAAPLTVNNCEIIDQIRQKMAKADIILNDTVNIINGYLNYKSTNQTPDAEINSMVDGDNFNELKEKIEKFERSNLSE